MTVNRRGEQTNFLGTDYGFRDNEVRLVKAGTIVGSNKATSSLWPTSLATATYGSSADLW